MRMFRITNERHPLMADWNKVEDVSNDVQNLAKAVMPYLPKAGAG